MLEKVRPLTIALLLAATALITGAFLTSTPAFAERKVIIVAPADGATIGPSFILAWQPVDFEIVRAGTPIDPAKGGHVHIYVDDNLQGHWDTRDAVLISDLSPGAHTIKLVLSDTNHNELPESASVSITVEAPPELVAVAGLGTLVQATLVVSIITLIVLIAAIFTLRKRS